ncbi:MAG TPA: DUF4965 domain-containing protein [Chitinophaga sp.]|uniref:glutaminase family protein n=1 Tax=Chitinophaga sp. TaxID=1869181 RepID=UPI002CBF3B3E|nr:DUF4965 domain-containing protein [Chitinophaga sp.]HVI48604.1 DUF4965 domain-containing protein [Chitinophaga sp.]
MKNHLIRKMLTCLSLSALAGNTLAQQQAPAYPLVTHDPYFSIWSAADTLNSATTMHWTGSPQSLTGMIKVDGTVYSVLGKESGRYTVLLPASDENGYTMKYTEAPPPEGWTQPGFDDSQWQTGAAPFSDDAGRRDGTQWTTFDLWTRRTFDLDHIPDEKFILKICHDDNIDVYLNGEKIYNYVGWLIKYKLQEIPDEARLKLKPKGNVLAVHIANTRGGAFLDFGMGYEKRMMEENNVQRAIQRSSTFNATQTAYHFECGGVNLTLTFTSPLLIKDLTLLSRPVSYVSYKVVSNDHKAHDVQLYFGASSAICVNLPSQTVATQQYNTGALSLLKAGTVEQPVLRKRGDDLRIDWGYMYVATPLASKPEQYVAGPDVAVAHFTSGQPITGKTDRDIVLSTIVSLGKVKSTPKEQLFLLGYDDLYAIQYFHTNVKAWWKSDSTQTIEKQLDAAFNDYTGIMKKCALFNQQLYRDAVKAGGEPYAKLCELAYRQSIAAHKLVRSPQGELLFLSKENFSNGCISTVDVTYPSAPLFLLYNPNLLKGMMNGIFHFSESGLYTKPFAAHDLGTYPLANGQAYGEDMPIEESGNMLIMTGAIAQAEGNAEYARRHWKVLSIWAEYLLKNGFDPANQLCTDDFAGHLARNTNLSLKAIMGIRSYAYLAEQLGEVAVAARYKDSSRVMAQRWLQLADAGDHYSLVFEDKDTWSQKYNMVWDKVLNFNLFPPEVYRKETSYYLGHQQKYGLPLDSRRTYTKSDWIMWTAVLADDFNAFVQPLYDYITATDTRVPLSEWHDTTNGKKIGFQARSVVGGYFMKMLDEKMNRQ